MPRGRSSRSAGRSAAPASGTASTGRSEQRDAAARAALTPLRPGERPTAVTVAAVVASLFAAGNMVALGWALYSSGGAPTGGLVVPGLVAALLIVLAVGLWRARYWAALGMQALLAVQIISGGMYLMLSGGPDLPTAVWLVIVVGSCVLFWFLVKAMARLQMPTTPEEGSPR